MTTHPADMTEDEYRRQIQARIEMMRVAEGRCGYCGVFDGPTHRCPPQAHLKVDIPLPKAAMMPACCAASGVGVCDYHDGHPL